RQALSYPCLNLRRDTQQPKVELVEAEALGEQGDAGLVRLQPRRVKERFERGDIGDRLERLVVLPSHRNPGLGAKIAEPESTCERNVNDFARPSPLHHACFSPGRGVASDVAQDESE